jgi:patatin-like phospholipase/acyl hydrolase
MARYRILSIDGGGIRGIIPAIVLERLSAEPGLSGWLERADLIAGTSTGGLLALGLAAGLPPAEIREVYETKGREIFDDSWLDNVVDIGKLRGADYSLKNLRREVRRILGTKTLAQLRKRVVITAFDLDNECPDRSQRTWKPKIFHNFPGTDSDGAQLAYKVGLYTSAAPTYFPSEDGYIDGGVFAPNPSMCALAQTQDPRQRERPRLSQVVLLSLGTGTPLQHIRGKSLDWGYVQWARPIIDLILDGVTGIADYECHRLLAGRYWRLAPAFPPGVAVPMDAVRKLPYMTQFARNLRLNDTIRWLREQWMRG